MIVLKESRGDYPVRFVEYVETKKYFVGAITILFNIGGLIIVGNPRKETG